MTVNIVYILNMWCILRYLIETSEPKFGKCVITSVTFYNCSNLGEFGCNYCKALNSNRYKCAWDTTANMCMFNENSSDIGTTDCPAPTIMKVRSLMGVLCGVCISIGWDLRKFGVICQIMLGHFICWYENEKQLE